MPKSARPRPTGGWPRGRAGFWLAFGCFAVLSGAAGAQERLESFRIDPAKVSVSGISSGAFMANQLHVAHSELIMGVGLVAGGLYGCAAWRVDAANGRLEATATRALDRCMAARAPVDPVATYKARAAALAEAGWIDPLAGLAGDRVYLFAGRADRVVAPATVERAAELYRALGIEAGDLEFRKFLERPPTPAGAGHSWLTEDCCQPCAANEAPYINDCDYDQAGAILRHIYGELRPKAEGLSGTFVEFQQGEFAPDNGPAANGLADTGIVYVPQDCAAGAPCALHVVLHGCTQSTESLGETFYRSIGINEWADSNAIVVLYPQARSVDRATLDGTFPDRGFRNAFAVNPYGCWNWWGYAHDERYALKDGAQIAAIYGMIRRLMGADAE